MQRMQNYIITKACGCSYIARLKRFAAKEASLTCKTESAPHYALLPLFSLSLSLSLPEPVTESATIDVSFALLLLLRVF